MRGLINGIVIGCGLLIATGSPFASDTAERCAPWQAIIRDKELDPSTSWSLQSGLLLAAFELKAISEMPLYEYRSISVGESSVDAEQLTIEKVRAVGGQPDHVWASEKEEECAAWGPIYYEYDKATGNVLRAGMQGWLAFALALKGDVSTPESLSKVGIILSETYWPRPGDKSLNQEAVYGIFDPFSPYGSTWDTIEIYEKGSVGRRVPSEDEHTRASIKANPGRRYVVALCCLDESLRLEPNNTEALNARANALIGIASSLSSNKKAEQWLLDRAITDLETIIRLSPASEHGRRAEDTIKRIQQKKGHSIQGQRMEQTSLDTQNTDIPLAQESETNGALKVRVEKTARIRLFVRASSQGPVEKSGAGNRTLSYLLRSGREITVTGQWRTSSPRVESVATLHGRLRFTGAPSMRIRATPPRSPEPGKVFLQLSVVCEAPESTAIINMADLRLQLPNGTRVSPFAMTTPKNTGYYEPFSRGMGGRQDTNGKLKVVFFGHIGTGEVFVLTDCPREPLVYLVFEVPKGTKNALLISDKSTTEVKTNGTELGTDERRTTP